MLLCLPSVSPKSSSSATWTHLIENGGSKYANPSKGGFEQLVTNCKLNIYNIYLHLHYQFQFL